MCTDGDDEPVIVGITGLVMLATVLVEDVLVDSVVQRMIVLENDISKSGHILTSGGMETEARPGFLVTFCIRQTTRFQFVHLDLSLCGFTQQLGFFQRTDRLFFAWFKIKSSCY